MALLLPTRSETMILVCEDVEYARNLYDFFTKFVLVQTFYGGWVLTNDSMGPGELVSMSDMYGFGRRFLGFAVCEVGLSFCILFSTNVWLGNSFHTCHRKKCLPIICRD